MKGLAIGLIAAVLIGGGVWLVLTQGVNDGEQTATNTAGQEQTTQPEETTGDTDQDAAESTEVSYSSSGFTPETITVKSGDTVTWTNDSGSSMWVASDVHPTHEILPDFDQLGSGESYSYTFDEPGEWEYHNHLLPSHTGTVVVE